jgi:hypothetical protein
MLAEDTLKSISEFREEQYTTWMIAFIRRARTKMVAIYKGFPVD